ncbi:YheC/YheD family protein [Paenibacillus sp. P96]|uniref:YheC/YheD family protein n=1 Tax=Paenibacillus zeirhizosphaerae TaxID=2987519 RepID=A0ABT9FT98_9BACL|nr:YheC/YheD family protein [Paenibacillus sp. P96]MDP4097899.1 YheC/YheD family protein [Paenibacillus sp. P96]
MNSRKLDKPIVAILTMHDNKRMFRGNKDNFQEIWETGSRMGHLVYVVTVKDLDTGKYSVKGYSYNRTTKQWEPGYFPRPQVVYNRIPDRLDEHKPSVRSRIEELQRAKDIALYNPGFFNKWTLFQALRTSPKTRGLVPATKRLQSSGVLMKMLQSYPNLYLKPESGKAGKGIMTVNFSRKNPMPYRLKIQNARKSTVYTTANFNNLWSRIQRKIGSTPYIVQQGIELATSRNRPFDLRVLAQKNRRGLWRVTGIGARLAGSRSITTHVPRGGSIEDPQKLLTHIFGTEMSTAHLQRVQGAALQIARQVEISANGIIGEMSMDLGVDRSGNLWFFEANAKPMKFDEPDIRKKSLERIFYYSSYLAEQQKY